MTALVALALGGAKPTDAGSSRLERIGSWPEFARGPALDVAIASHYAYVAIGEGGLVVLDMANPAHPVRVGGYLPTGRTDLVRVEGSRAYLGTKVHRGGGCEMEGWRGNLVILDVSDPANPAPLGNYITGSEITNFYVDGDRVYLGDDGNHSEHSFRILDVGNPTHPVTLSADQTTGGNAMDVAGGLAYVSTYANFSIWDVTRPASPTLLASASSESGSSIQGIQALGHVLYVISGGWDYGELDIYDTSSPSEPRLLARLELEHMPSDIQVAGDYAYLAMPDAGLAAINVINPGKPVLVGTWGTPGTALRVKISSGLAFVADYHEGLQIFDVRNPLDMNRIASFNTGLTAREVRVSGDKAYLLSCDTHPSFQTGIKARSRLEVLNVLNPAQPVLLGAYDSPRVIASLDVVGTLAYLGWTLGGNSGLQILDLRDPIQPVYLSDTKNEPSGSQPYDIGVRVGGRHAYVTKADDNILRIFDVSDPAKPVQLSITNSYAFGSVRAVGDHVYATSGWQFEVWNMADLKNPMKAGSFDFLQGGNNLGALCVSDDYVYAGLGWKGFSIVDVHLPAKPVAVGGYDTAGEVNDIWVENHYAYLAEGWEGLEVFNASNPAQPFPIGRVPMRGQALGVQVSGNYACVAESGGGLAIISLAPQPLTIYEDPASLSAAIGDSATLTVKAYAQVPLSYQWYRGESGDVSQPIAGAHSATCTMPVLTEAVAFWVRVSGGGHVRDSRTAWVNPVPPVSMELLGLWPGWRRGPSMDVQVDGSLAFIAAGDAGMMIYDFADPSVPRRLGGFDTKGLASGVALSGKLVFLASGDKGLRVIDVRNPAVPLEIGNWASDGYANKIRVVGTYAYLLGDQLRILDIRDPTHPQVVGNYAVTGNNFEVLGQYAFVVGYSWEEVSRIDRGFLDVIDVSNPADPRFLGEYKTVGRVNSVAMTGNYAYLAVGSTWDAIANTQRPGSFQVIDVSNTTQPRWVTSIKYDEAQAVCLSGSFAYAACNNAALFILDISKPAAPVQLGGFSAIQTASALAASGSRIYVASGDGGIQVIDVKTPASAKLLGGVQTGVISEDVTVLGHYAFLADGAGGLQIIDIGDAAQPVLAGTYVSNVRHVAANGSFIYLAADMFEVLDVSDPAQPNRISSIEEWPDDICLAGDYAYLSGSQFRTMNLRNPVEPKLASIKALSDQWSSRGMSIDKHYAGVAQNWGGLQILDFSAPAEPKWVGAYYASAPVWDVAMRSDIACVILGSELPGLEVIDLRDIQRPARIARVPLPLANNVAFMGSYACVTGEGLQIFDLSDPHQPVRVGSHKLGSQTHGLQVAGNLVYVAAGEYGLAIYRLTTPMRLNQPVRDGSGLRLTWQGGPGIRLQSANSLSDRDWQDVPIVEGVDSLQLQPTNPAAFFRLVNP